MPPHLLTGDLDQVRVGEVVERNGEFEFDIHEPFTEEILFPGAEVIAKIELLHAVERFIPRVVATVCLALTQNHAQHNHPEDEDGFFPTKF